MEEEEAVAGAGGRTVVAALPAELAGRTVAAVGEVGRTVAAGVAGQQAVPIRIFGNAWCWEGWQIRTWRKTFEWSLTVILLVK